MSRRTWQTNADEFAALDEGEGWPFAVLVACSVEKGTAGRPPGNRANRHDSSRKTSASEFAGRAGTSPHRVLRYLEAWDRAAKKGLCVPADRLTPEVVWQTSFPETAFKAFYDATNAGGRPRDSKPEDAVTIIARRGAQAVIEAMTPAQRDDVVEALVQQEVKEAGLQPAKKRAKPGDPRPVWEPRVTRITLDGMQVIQTIQELREQGRADLAEVAYEEFRRSLLELLTRLESANVPDTAEGVTR